MRPVQSIRRRDEFTTFRLVGGRRMEVAYDDVLDVCPDARTRLEAASKASDAMTRSHLTEEAWQVASAIWWPGVLAPVWPRPGMSSANS